VIRKRGKDKLKEMLGLCFGSTNDDEDEKDSDDNG
jgi:hypothetical protein